MLGSKQGLAIAARTLALGVAAAGCSGNAVSAGSESDAVNLSRCFGADCGVHAQSLSSQDVLARPCGDVEGPLADPVVFEEITGGLMVLAAVEGAEGSVWALQTEGGGRDGFGTLNLAHFSADGARLASVPVGGASDHTVVKGTLAVDTTGVVTIGVYSAFAPDADSDVVEELELSSFDADLAPLGASRRFRGMAGPQLLGGPGGSIWLAGDAEANSPHGAISRITQREPDWIQTAVPSSGQGTGTGVSGLAVGDDGVAAVLAGVTPKWSGTGPDVLKLGISTFDATGKPLWTLKLPTEYASGWVPALGGTAEGDLVVVGALGENGQSLLVRQVSRSGSLGWAYTVDGSSPSVEVKRDSGRAFVGALNRVAVIDAAGESCRQFSVAVDDESKAAAEPWRADGEYLLAAGSGLVRFRVPE